MRISDIIELAWGVLCPGVFGVMISYLVGLFVFGPIHARAIWTPPQTSFRIADIIILLAQMQLVGGVLFAVFPIYYRGPDVGRIGIALVVWILLAFWWWTGVRLLARAKVDYAPHRLLFLGVFVPLGYTATLGLILMPFAALISFAILLALVINGDYSRWSEVLPLLLLLVGNAATIGAVVGTRAFCRKIVGRARDDVALHDGVAMGPLVETAKPLFIREHLPMASEREVRIIDEPLGTAKQ